MRYIFIIGSVFIATLGFVFVKFHDNKDNDEEKRLFSKKIVTNRVVPIGDNPNLLRRPSIWADSVLNTLTLEEKIGQLFIIRAHSDKDDAYYSMVEKQISDYHVGGLCFFQGDAKKQAELTNRYQSVSKTPLFISIDAEWGLSMRLKDAKGFPRQMTLGAMENDTLVYKMAVLMAKQLSRIGVNFNFAPVVDINSNPKNPVIGNRSFGENPNNVFRKALMYMKGLQDNHILACAKHFPGHGDTDSDSHLTLPVISHTAQYIDSVDLMPFKKMAHEQIASIMVAHLHIPAIDNRKNIASTLSEKIVRGILIDKIGFKGLIVTDALEMKGVSSYHAPGQIELQALKAGNDLLLLPTNIKTAIDTIQSAVHHDSSIAELVKNSCRKILYYKYLYGIHKNSFIKTENINQDINNEDVDAINHAIIENAITLLINKNEILPIKDLKNAKIASLAIGETQINDFQKGMERYAHVTHFVVPKSPDEMQTKSLINKLSDFSAVIIGLHNTNNSASKNYGIENESIQLINAIKATKKVVLAVFANPYSLSVLKDTSNIAALIMAYQDDVVTQDKVSQLIFGGIRARGSLPVSVDPYFNYGFGIKTEETTRLHYTHQNLIVQNTDSIYKIDSIINFCIENQILPGCRIIASHKGSVFYDKCFGFHTYNKSRKVLPDDIYDLASITKIYATIPVMINMVEDGKINLDSKLSDYLPALKGTNKESIIIREILAHQAGLQAWIPYYLETINNSMPDTRYYSKTKTPEKSIELCRNMFVLNSFTDTIYKRIYDSELMPSKTYKYSDLGYYLFYKMIENVYNKAFEEVVAEKYYKNLGFPTMGFHPTQSFPLRRIVPSEDDMEWRRQVVHGYVNDQGAALLGGVCGHAGLFSNAYDAAAFGQLFLNNGVYGGIRYFQDSTLAEFTKYQYPQNRNRRGLGFDKPIAEVNSRNGQTPPTASNSSYGHSGFTGTLVWIDPEYDFVYVFLSNRTFPNSKNNKLSKLDIRSKIQEILYFSLKPKSKIK